MALLEETPGRTAGTRARDLLAAALGPLLVGYTAVAAVFAVVTALAPRASFSTGGVLLAALPGWLAGHQVPLVIQGRELGALPLLPTLLLALLVGRVVLAVAVRADARGPRETGWIAGAAVLAHAVAGLTAALLLDGPVAVDPLAGFYYPALVSGAACAVALAPRSGLLEVAAERVDVLALRGLRAGLLACAVLIAVGAGVVVLGLATSFGTVTSLFTGGPGAGVGLLLLSAAYLPNAVVAGVGFAAGPGFGIGETVIAPVGFVGGPVPAVPLLGALPSAPQVWWPALFLLPLAAGALVGWVLRDVDESPTARLRAVSVAAVVVAAVFAVLAGSAGGALAGGPFDPLDLRAALLSLALVGWIGLPGAMVAWFAGEHPVAAGLIGPDDEDAAPDAADASDSADSPDSADSADSPDEDVEEDAPEEAVEQGGDAAEESDEDEPEDAVAPDTEAADEDR